MDFGPFREKRGRVGRDSCLVSDKLYMVDSDLKSMSEWKSQDWRRMSGIVGTCSIMWDFIARNRVGMGASGAMSFGRIVLGLGPLPRAQSGDA
jgi:hypothetical protein